MNSMTAENLRSAYGAESMGYMRYKIWGKKAKEDGFSNVARLFEAITYAEEVHASNHFRELKGETGDEAYLVASKAGFGIGSTSDNLQESIEGEDFAFEQMYPAYIAVAKDQNEKGGLISFQHAMKTEKVHSNMFTKAKKAVDNGNDMKLKDVQICSVCGLPVEGDAPEICPVCHVPKDQFVAFSK